MIFAVRGMAASALKFALRQKMDRLLAPRVLQSEEVDYHALCCSLCNSAVNGLLHLLRECIPGWSSLVIPSSGGGALMHPAGCTALFSRFCYFTLLHRMVRKCTFLIFLRRLGAIVYHTDLEQTVYATCASPLPHLSTIYQQKEPNQQCTQPDCFTAIYLPAPCCSSKLLYVLPAAMQGIRDLGIPLPRMVRPVLLLLQSLST